MDEALGFASIDLVKRTYFVMSDLGLRRNIIEDLPREDLEHFFRLLCDSLACTMHLRLEYGSNDHHKIEACFKALRCHSGEPSKWIPEEISAIPSSKGSM